VLSLQLARDRARQSRGGSDGHVSLSASNSETTEFGNQSLLEGLEAENAQLRGHVVDLLLELQASRDALGALGHQQSEILPNRRRRPPGRRQ
jgi:hypothetical protein